MWFVRKKGLCTNGFRAFLCKKDFGCNVRFFFPMFVRFPLVPPSLSLPLFVFFSHDFALSYLFRVLN